LSSFCKGGVVQSTGGFIATYFQYEIQLKMPTLSLKASIFIG